MRIVTGLNCRLPAAHPDESSSCIPWALLARSPDRLRRVGRSWDRLHVGGECKDCCGELYSERKMNFKRTPIRAGPSPRVYF